LVEIWALLPDITFVGVATQLTTGAEEFVPLFSAVELEETPQPMMA
jgi:hypothetical protein